MFAGQARALELPPPSGLRVTGASEHGFQVLWHPVAGASEYGIRVFHDGVLLRQLTVSSDQVRVASLRPGTAYQVYARTDGTGTPVAITVLTPRPLSFGQKVASFARSLVGDPYAYGADGPHAFDCSGLAKYAYQHYGRYLPRTADDQYHYLRHVVDPTPGDLVFFVSDGEAYHVGIYEGRGTMVAAATPAQGVVDQPLWTNAVAYGAP
jgi:cell wall-associated NlpC family hydrolase